MKLLRVIDGLLNRITMYRLLVYGLSALATVAIGFSLTDRITLAPRGLISSLVALLIVCYAVNKLMAIVWRAMPNTESWLITALILFFLLPPATTDKRLIAVIWVGAIAMASKYVLAYHRKHVFNPAAAALVIAGLLDITFGAWWVGTSAMTPFVILLGLIVVRKIRRFPMVLIFLAVSLITTTLVNLSDSPDINELIRQTITSSPLLFLGFIMLTEPATMPPTRRWQTVFGALVGLLSAAQLHFGNTSVTAEMALVIGNGLAFMVSPRYKLLLKLKEKNQLSAKVIDFVFTPNRRLDHRPGQYLELTLPHSRRDRRGIRRTFTIASSPTESNVHFGIKFYDPSSSFKRTLRDLKPGRTLIGGQLAGNFTLPKDQSKKLVFIAGGIGITPFRSMAKYLIDTKEHRDIILFYLISDSEELSYQEIFAEAAKFGVKTMPVLSTEKLPAVWRGLKGPLRPETIQQIVTDLNKRTCYISGPPRMVDAHKTMLVKIGVRRRNIITDHFAGY